MDLVDFDLAKKLKEKGFNWFCSHYYRTKRKDLFKVFPSEDWSNTKERINAPTIYQVLKWLRKEKGLHIAIYIVNDGFVSSTISFKWDESYCEHDIEHEHYNYKGYSTYEEAALAEIEYVLDNLL